MIRSVFKKLVSSMVLAVVVVGVSVAAQNQQTIRIQQAQAALDYAQQTQSELRKIVSSTPSPVEQEALSKAAAKVAQKQAALTQAQKGPTWSQSVASATGTVASNITMQRIKWAGEALGWAYVVRLVLASGDHWAIWLNSGKINVKRFYRALKQKRYKAAFNNFVPTSKPTNLIAAITKVIDTVREDVALCWAGCKKVAAGYKKCAELQKSLSLLIWGEPKKEEKPVLVRVVEEKKDKKDKD